LNTPLPASSPDYRALLEAREHDPFHILGCHAEGAGWRITVLRPDVEQARVVLPDGRELGMTRLGATALFELRGEGSKPAAYRLAFTRNAARFTLDDPYRFVPQPPVDALYLFNEGRQWQAYRHFGALAESREGIAGVCFRVWAPNAGRVSVVGDFNDWDGRVHPMGNLGGSGAWELFIPGLDDWTLYKFEIRNREHGTVQVKTDPYARFHEMRPATGGKVVLDDAYAWGDAAWMTARAQWDWLHAPINIYELHAGAWMRHPDGSFYTWPELTERLIPYVLELGFTHVELMPVTEYPYDPSWGYQATGYFAPSSRYGSPAQMRAFVDACHQAGIGVILDWVPAHFPKDGFALAHFDGSALYEHADPRMGEHPDWGTLVFNYGRNEVKSFLLSSAHYWMSEFHIDALRVDAVASMLYLDYSRKAGEWLPNRYGGRENLDAVDFLRALNIMVHEQFPGALTFAEESTSWPMVSRPVYLGGLGFSYKWNMGWMNDTLRYFAKDPVHRAYHHAELTFGQIYAYTENFVLPLSHDEVVHGKGALLAKMPGDDWQKFANLRLLFAWQMLSPGKKLNFMGNEFGPWREWNSGRELEWDVLQYPQHAGIRSLFRDLSHSYRNLPALHELDVDGGGFCWLDCQDAPQSLLSFVRYDRAGNHVVVVLNFTPVPHQAYRLGVPHVRRYREIINTDAALYGGSNLGNGGACQAEPQPWMSQPASLLLTLPPLAAVVLVPD
jgi:1,4-alpha-glucan branching enzyme